MDNILDVSLSFCINQKNGQLYCIQNYPHQNFAQDNIDEDIKDPIIKEDITYTTMKSVYDDNKTYTTIILRLNKFDKWCWWGEIGRECESYFNIIHEDSSCFLNDKLYIMAVKRHNTNSQLIRIFNIKTRKFELFCHHINNTYFIGSNISFTTINNQWILIAFVKRRGKHNEYFKRTVFELIDVQERKFRQRSKKIPLILPDTFLLHNIYATINTNNQASMYKKIVEQFTRNIENKLSLSTYNVEHVPIVLIHLITCYYYCSVFQIWFHGVWTTNKNGWQRYFKTWQSDKFKQMTLFFNYDDLWFP